MHHSNTEPTEIFTLLPTASDHADKLELFLQIDRLMSKLFNSLSPPMDNIAGVGDAFQRDSLDSSHKVVFEESGHGVKFSPQSKPPGLWSSWSCNTETCCLYRVWITWFM